ncbi:MULTISPECIES: dTDP-4-dehydrorhamnose 3,5-epimerase family protein [unclassified Campylobacter]|uniref:dTDP-4-dehydrorhamnose 3,5-epimerase family protein n=1 Tax=unclassified Campylobacter TaxID=2593542 RepID=UPI0012381B2F|nr:MULTISPECIES: dTDP-4-dehydrorhamnose 3,5-epimerase family protein [unclassified Campylobacter]KAA6224584.1 dTDP-4-keto-6-deoxy-D-glucose epimerase [Campylobacter sp. LR185c]KAA6224826.1 dTDP-4-keto-6-deoxy-D-glucose epimerase [Campylobacter sp. LR286c]KAA6227974.1 dTDP-4-keto-6-deoxy-D-glucose epimerase [Campylobacter sp. LR196d]KAA6233453.1 dTDP-4-keto-6-deoxy-D-glucose epimerase [Campylobacter sp. LR291e]KAA6234390.1 dTDP-4-keto-6-deoxy-D-glucose epimerase [Campylobacter sp. LR264d]
MGFSFDIQESKLAGVFIIKPNIAWDNRGSIYTSFYKDDIEKLLPKNLFFKHDKFSLSCKNVLRGIHGDSKSYKLVSCVYGEIIQVVVDLRKESPTYLKWEKFIINKDNQLFILMPPNMGNAYFVKSNEALYHYKYAYTGEYLDVHEQFSLAYNDKSININWGDIDPILSSRDLNHG